MRFNFLHGCLMLLLVNNIYTQILLNTTLKTADANKTTNLLQDYTGN